MFGAKYFMNHYSKKPDLEQIVEQAKATPVARKSATFAPMLQKYQLN
jgi:hypothetical protein